MRFNDEVNENFDSYLFYLIQVSEANWYLDLNNTVSVWNVVRNEKNAKRGQIVLSISLLYPVKMLRLQSILSTLHIWL